MPEAKALTMKRSQMLPMKDGNGDTSYANNSSFQRAVLSAVRPIREEAIEGFLGEDFPACFRVADLGCSSGPNTLLLISEVVETVRAVLLSSPVSYKTNSEVHVFLNDLPDNDFNGIFKSLPSLYEDLFVKKGNQEPKCFVSASPGSFYERIFPGRSMHVIHSACSVHWLSQVPPGIKGMNSMNIYISESTPPAVHEAYLKQFQSDFSKFLQFRHKEMVPGGRLLLTLIGRTSSDPANDNHSRFWGLLATSLLELAAEGLVEDGDIISFNMPLYAPSVEEVKYVLNTTSSFSTDRLETYKVDFDTGTWLVNGGRNTMDHRLNVGKTIARTMRAIIEPTLTDRFGEAVMDYLFEVYAREFARSSIEDTNVVVMAVSLTAKKA